MNIVILSGRLTKDAAVSYSQGSESMAIARFTLAVDRKGKKQEGQPTADFINCVAFGKTAEVIEKYTSKGSKIALRGHWQSGSYKNRDNQTVYTNDCIVDEFEFGESKKETQDNAPSAPEYGKPDQDGFMNIPSDIPDEELPFN